MPWFARTRAALVTLLTLAGTACDSCHDDTPSTTVRGVPGVTSTGGAGAGGARSDGDGGAAGADDAGGMSGAVVRVTITSPLTAGWTLVGEYQGARNSPATVVLVHQLGSNRAEWAPLVARLHAGTSQPGLPQLSTFALDLRGHGESTRRTEEGVASVVSWQSFGNDRAQWAGVVDDVRAALEWVRSRPDAGRIVVVGSSIGSTAALLAAQNEPMVSAVVMLSPGVDYRGLDTLAPMRAYAATGRAALLIAGQGDADSAAAVGQLMAAAAGDARVQREVYDGTGAHGVAIGAQGVRPAMWARIESFVHDAINPLNQPPAQPQGENAGTDVEGSTEGDAGAEGAEGSEGSEGDGGGERSGRNGRGAGASEGPTGGTDDGRDAGRRRRGGSSGTAGGANGAAGAATDESGATTGGGAGAGRGRGTSRRPRAPQP